MSDQRRNFLMTLDHGDLIEHIINTEWQTREVIARQQNEIKSYENAAEQNHATIAKLYEALAVCDPWILGYDSMSCAVCGNEAGEDEKNDHRPDCLYKKALEAQNEPG